MLRLVRASKHAESAPKSVPNGPEKAPPKTAHVTIVGFPRYWQESVREEAPKTDAMGGVVVDREELKALIAAEELEELDYSFAPGAKLKAALLRHGDRLVTVAIASLTTIAVLLILGALNGDEQAGSATVSQPAAEPEAASSVVAPATNEREVDADELALTVVFALAADRVGMAVPTTHTLRFEGMTGVLVSRDGAVLGVTPFNLTVPDTNQTVLVRFEREGYRAQQQRISLERSSVDVQLDRPSRARERQRRRDRRPPPPEARPPHEGPPPGLFGTGPISGQR